MQTFKDNGGRTWTVSVNVASIKRVRALAGVNLLDAAEGELLTKLSADPEMLVNVLFALCKTEADAHNVTDEAFAEAIAGDVIDHATTALLEEIVSFFPKSRRELMRKAVGKMTSLQDVAARRLGSRLDAINPEEIVSKFLAEIFLKLVYELAGIVGVDPGPLTIRELSWMAEARGRADWERTSLICAVLVNSNPYRKRGSSPARPSDFNPYHARKGKDVFLRVKVSELKDLMPKGLKANVNAQ